MKLKYVKALLIGIVGICAAGEMQVEASAGQETGGLFAGVTAAAGLTGDFTEEDPMPEEEKEPELVIATVDTYLHVRSTPDLEGEIIGKLYNHAVGILLEEVTEPAESEEVAERAESEETEEAAEQTESEETEEAVKRTESEEAAESTEAEKTADWYYIESGNVKGYVSAEYVLRGEEGRALADEVGTRYATVDTQTLRVRTEPTTESDIVGLVPGGNVYTVSEETEGWAKITVEETEGYVSLDYVKLHTENAVAESREEEEERLRKEEEERRIAEENARREEEARQAQLAAQQAAQRSQQAVQQSQQAAQQSQPAPSPNAQSSGQNAATQKGSSTADSKADNTASAGSANTSAGSLGSQIADFGLRFVGNPYVYGGTSLTNGADCSGFVMQVYRNFGITLPRTSGEQAKCGTAVAGIENARKGDLICYPGHIGIYIGDGKIVHASTAATGIKVSTATYRQISAIRRIV